MRESIRRLSDLDWLSWGYNGLSTVVIGGANAVVTLIGVNVVDPHGFTSTRPGFYKLVASVFVVNALTNIFFYLKQSPLPAPRERRKNGGARAGTDPDGEAGIPSVDEAPGIPKEGE